MMKEEFYSLNNIPCDIDYEYLKFREEELIHECEMNYDRSFEVHEVHYDENSDSSDEWLVAYEDSYGYDENLWR